MSQLMMAGGASSGVMHLQDPTLRDAGGARTCAPRSGKSASRVDWFFFIARQVGPELPEPGRLAGQLDTITAHR